MKITYDPQFQPDTCFADGSNFLINMFASCEATVLQVFNKTTRLGEMITQHDEVDHLDRTCVDERTRNGRCTGHVSPNSVESVAQGEVE